MILKVNYDADLTLVKVTDGGILGENMHSPNYTLNPYKLTWSNDTALQNITANGVIVTLTFLLPKDTVEKTYNVSLAYDYANLDIIDVDMQPVAVNLQGGGITVKNSMPGDVNANGMVNAEDRMILARYLAGWEGYEQRIADFAAADIDGNGSVNAADRMILARHLAGWEGYDRYFN
jgi:hypothetical protein